MAETTFNRITRNKAISSVSFTLKDLEGLARIVFDKNQIAIQNEHAFIRSLNVKSEDEATYLDLVTNNQKMTIFVNGAEGNSLIAYDPSCFQSHVLPLNITSITIETQTFRQVHTKADPNNFVRIHLDFSKMNFGSPQFKNDGTLLNISNLQVAGDNEAWVTSTFKSLEDRIKSAKNARSFLHAPGVYILGLVVAVFPTLIFLIDQVYRNNQTYIDSQGGVVKLGAAAYAVLFGVLVYRLLFNYGLWAFPSVELANDRDISAKHRKFLFSVMTSLLVGAISYYLYKK